MWAVNLSALLKGRALDVYALLPQEKALDYAALKTALLRRFEKTEDGFREYFRRCRPEVGETFTQFAVRLGSYLDRRIEFGKVNKTYNGLYDLVLRDQFISICNRDLSLFLKERIPKSIEEMCMLADQFKEARHVNILTLVSSSKKETTFENRNPVSARDQRSQKEQVPPKTICQSFSQQKKTGKDIRCYKCSRLGHIASQCKQSSSKNQSFAVKADTSSESGSSLKEHKDSGKCSAFTSITSTSTFSMANSSDLLTTSACSIANFSDQMPVCVGEINDQSVQVLRDTGCNGVIVRRSLVHDDQLTGDHQVCVLADGSKIETPIAKVNVDTPYFVGEVNAWCLHAPLYPLIIGNIPHARDPHDPNKDWKPSAVNAVVTRQQKRMEGKKIKPLSVPEIIGSEVCPEDMLKAQEEDETLKNLRALVGKETNYNRVKYILKKGMLFQVFQSEKVENGKQFTQLVVPKKYRMKVLSLAHESLMAGHLATSRTIDKVLAEFYWPGVQADARRFCRSCDICQRTPPKGRTTKVPMSVMPIIDEPFRRVAVDLVGPIQPMTDNGNRYILTLVDFSTRYPEAVALKGIETERVAEALVDIFCRIGVPKEMLTGMGTQFISELMGEVSRLLSMKQLSTTPYHPMCNGLVERFNGTLKQILRRLCSERPKDWDKYLSAALFAYRDAPQESLGFSPFELVYGHRVRGPMRILRELWTKEETDSEDHLMVIKEFLQRLRAANLTAKPSKCFIGFSSIECLGYIAGKEELRPIPDKVEAIQNCIRPITKKQVRSFLGLVGFYRKFIPHFSAVAAPLSDLTKKGQPNKVLWGETQQNAFITLKSALMVTPVLKLPNISEEFILQTDASDVGIGAVLLQYENGIKKPVAYASKKLTAQQVKYSTIEKECFAIIWAVQKFQRYLYGKQFMLETDHQPLIYLSQSKVLNARLMRWSLLLQPYRFRIVAIKGSENVGADCLSRL
ncbi:uncharacterized protein LOC134245806 isoform X2 [Saccostrea cucullata]